MIIDMHCHLLPPALIEALRRREAAPCIGPDGSGGELMRIFRAAVPFDAADNDPDRRIRKMDGWGVDLQAISLPGLFGIDSLPLAEAARLTRLFNDGMAEVVTAHPGRFRAIAALPLADPDAAAAELRRTRGLGLAGAILPADCFLTLAKARAWVPLLAAAAQTGAHLFIHPGPLPADMVGRAVDAPGPHGDTVEHRRVTVDTQNKLNDVMVTLGLTDLLDLWPGLSVQVANLGGALPFYLERMDQLDRIRHAGAPPASERLRRVHVDSASFGRRAVAAAADAFGADRVLLGTDHPIFDVRACIAGVREAGLGAAGTAAALGATAEALLEL